MRSGRVDGRRKGGMAPPVHPPLPSQIDMYFPDEVVYVIVTYLSRDQVMPLKYVVLTCKQWQLVAFARIRHLLPDVPLHDIQLYEDCTLPYLSLLQFTYFRANRIIEAWEDAYWLDKAGIPCEVYSWNPQPADAHNTSQDENWGPELLHKVWSVCPPMMCSTHRTCLRRRIQ